MKIYFEIRKLLKSYGFKKIIMAGFTEIYRKIWLETINNSFSQCGEDLVVEKYFDKHFIGRYMEIGAYHPTRLSNTYRLYKKGWRGIIVEPNPSVKELFKSFRPMDKFYNIGISNKNQVLNYYQFLIPALNTFSKNDADNSVKNGHRLENITKIQTKKVVELIEGEIDYLSIDTEGFDEMILKNWPWYKCKPKIICAETDKNFQIKKFLLGKGYKIIYKNIYNSIFVSEKLELAGDRKQ